MLVQEQSRRTASPASRTKTTEPKLLPDARPSLPVPVVSQAAPIEVQMHFSTTAVPESTLQATSL